MLEHAIRQLRICDITNPPSYDGPDHYQILQVHDFTNFKFLGRGWRAKLHHVWDMRFMLGKFYPGLFDRTEIVGLDAVAHFTVTKLLARESSSSKWRRHWHSSRQPQDLGKRLPPTTDGYPPEYRAATEECSSAYCEFSPRTLPPAAAAALAGREGKRRAALEPFNQVLPPRNPWYQRTRRRPRQTTVRAWAFIGQHLGGDSGAHSSAEDLILPPAGTSSTRATRGSLDDDEGPSSHGPASHAPSPHPSSSLVESDRGADARRPVPEQEAPSSGSGSGATASEGDSSTETSHAESRRQPPSSASSYSPNGTATGPAGDESSEEIVVHLDSGLRAFLQSQMGPPEAGPNGEDQETPERDRDGEGAENTGGVWKVPAHKHSEGCLVLRHSDRACSGLPWPYSSPVCRAPGIAGAIL